MKTKVRIQYTLQEDELALTQTKKPKKNQLCFAIMLKHFQVEGNHPRATKYINASLINCIAQQLKIKTNHLEYFNWEGKSTERYRVEIREFCGYRLCSQSNIINMKKWLVENVISQGLKQHTFLANAHKYFKEHRIEPPCTTELIRHIQSAYHNFEEELFSTISNQLPSDFCEQIDDLLKLEIDNAEPGSDDISDIKFKQIKKNVAGSKLKNVKYELIKLNWLRSLNMPNLPIERLSRRLLHKYYSRILVERPSHIQRHPEIKRYALMAIFSYYRTQYLIDDLADLLLQLIHKMQTKAENFVKKKIIADITRVDSKYDVLYTLADIAINNPEGIIRNEIYTKIPQETLKAIVKELSCQGRWFETQVHIKMHSLYSHSHRRVLLTLLEAFEFHSTLSASQPLLDAISFIKAHRNHKGKHYPNIEDIPIEGVVPKEWLNAIMITESDGVPDVSKQVHRMYYEIAVFQELFRQLQCKMIWIDGAYRYQNPDHQLPKDFEENRDHYYQLLGLPRDPWEFIRPQQLLLSSSLESLNNGMPTNSKVNITDKDGGSIKITPSGPQDIPHNIQRLHLEIQKKWSTINLIDMLKEADLQIGFTEQFHTVASRQQLSSKDLQQRLLLALYAIGTNSGLKRISSANEDVSYDDLRYIKRLFIDAPNVRAAIVKVVNKVLAVRDPRCWGEGTTTVACDSKKISVWDQNLMVEWHSRYQGRGVMVYWHVDESSLCIYSQLKTCSSSEVGAVIKGLLSHGTNMKIKNATMDTHGQSLIGFGAGEFLGFDLLPRLKNIDKQKLYYSLSKDKKRYGNLNKILKETINWELMAENYDETVKHMVALKLGFIEPNMFIRRFSHDNYQHPVYQTLVEFGKMAKTIFLCRYLSDENLRIEIHESQNIVERLNSIMGFIFYGKVGEINSNDKEEQELSIVSLHLLQACMGYINTLLIQEILAQPAWQNVLTQEDKRALNVLFHSHINPYGLFPLDLSTRLGIGVESQRVETPEETVANR